MRACLFAAALAMMALPTAPQAAEAGGFRLDPKASTIGFELRALGWIKVLGSARAEGRVTIDEKTAEIDIQVTLASLKMARDGYREWAMSAEFFDAKRHPELTFRAREVAVATLQRGGPISGELTVRGVSKTARFQLHPSDCAARAIPCRVRADGQLSRRMFGMRTRRLTLGDRIGVSLDLKLVPVP